MLKLKIFVSIFGFSLLSGLILSCSLRITTDMQAQAFFRSCRSNTQEETFNNPGDALRAYQSLEEFFGKKEIKKLHASKKLAGGLSDATIFEFKLNEQCYVGRLFPENFDQQEMMQEVDAQRAAAHVGYAPKIYLFDLQRRFMLMELIEGKNLKTLGYDEVLFEKCIDTLRAFHSDQKTAESYGSMHVRVYSKNRIGLDAQCYINKCAELYPESNIIAELQKYTEQLCDVADAAVHPIALTHNDFHCGNILVDHAGAVKVIDWTDAGFDNPFNDCAILLHEYVPDIKIEQDFNYYYFSEQRRENFLKHYLERSPLPQESAWLRLLSCLYRIEVMAKIIANPITAGSGKNEIFQSTLSKSIDLYVRDNIYDEELVKESGYMVWALRAWIGQIKRYVEHEFDKDKQILSIAC